MFGSHKTSYMNRQRMAIFSPEGKSAILPQKEDWFGKAG